MINYVLLKNSKFFKRINIIIADVSHDDYMLSTKVASELGIKVDIAKVMQNKSDSPFRITYLKIYNSNKEEVAKLAEELERQVILLGYKNYNTEACEVISIISSRNN